MASSTGSAEKPITFNSVSRPSNLPDELAEQIRARIRSGEFAPGARLPSEPILAEMFEVSRNVVREALARLKLAGYVEIRRGIGSFVGQDVQTLQFKVAPEDLLDEEQLVRLYELRVEIASGAAALAAQKRTPEQLEALREALSRVDAASDDWEVASDRVIDFHFALAKATGNPFFAALMAHLHGVLRKVVRTLRFSASSDELRKQAIVREHHTVFDAIEARDAEGARQAMRTHLTKGIERHLAKSPPERPLI